MEVSKLIGCRQYTVDLYDFKLLPKNDKSLDIYARHNNRMSLYEAKDYELTKINVKTVEAAFEGKRDGLSVRLSETKCEEQEILQITVSLNMALLPKITETIQIPLVKTLKENEITQARLDGIRKRLVNQRELLQKLSGKNLSRYMAEKREVNYCSAGKEDLISLKDLPQGYYVITVSALLMTPGQYMSVGINKVNDICPGTYIGFPPEAQTSAFFPYYVKVHIEVNQGENVSFWGNVGTSYRLNFNNLIMTAEKVVD